MTHDSDIMLRAQTLAIRLIKQRLSFQEPRGSDLLLAVTKFDCVQLRMWESRILDGHSDPGSVSQGVSAPLRLPLVIQVLS
jgi:hypothetical protein